MITITIETSNAAFDDNKSYEIARILDVVSNQVENDYGDSFYLFDINGNKVGEYIDTGEA